MSFSQGAVRSVRPTRSTTKPPDRDKAKKSLDAALSVHPPPLSPMPPVPETSHGTPNMVTLSPSHGSVPPSQDSPLQSTTDKMASDKAVSPGHEEPQDTPLSQRQPRRRQLSGSAAESRDSSSLSLSTSAIPPVNVNQEVPPVPAPSPPLAASHNKEVPLTRHNTEVPPTRHNTEVPPAAASALPPPVCLPAGCGDGVSSDVTTSIELPATQELRAGAAEVSASPAALPASACDVTAPSHVGQPTGGLQGQGIPVPPGLHPPVPPPASVPDTATDFTLPTEQRKKLFQRHLKELTTTYTHLQRVSTLPRLNTKVLSVLVTSFSPNQERALHHLNAHSLSTALSTFSFPTFARKISNHRLIIEIPFSASPLPLLTMTTLCGVQVSCRLALGPGLVQGFTVEDPSTASLDDEALVTFFSRHSAPRVRILTCMRARLAGVPGIKLTMASSVLPNTLTVDNHDFALKPFVAAPMFCTSCQRLGHTFQRCSNRPRCKFCVSEDHGASSCPVRDHPLRHYCSQCSGAHLSNSDECPGIQLEWRVAMLHATTDLGLSEACLRVLRDEAGRRCQEATASGAPLPVVELPEPPRLPSSSPPASPSRVHHGRSRPRRRRVTPSISYATAVKSRFIPPPDSQLRDLSLGSTPPPTSSGPAIEPRPRSPPPVRPPPPPSSLPPPTARPHCTGATRTSSTGRPLFSDPLPVPEHPAAARLGLTPLQDSRLPSRRDPPHHPVAFFTLGANDYKPSSSAMFNLLNNPPHQRYPVAYVQRFQWQESATYLLTFCAPYAPLAVYLPSPSGNGAVVRRPVTAISERPPMGQRCRYCSGVLATAPGSLIHSPALVPRATSPQPSAPTMSTGSITTAKSSRLASPPPVSGECLPPPTPPGSGGCLPPPAPPGSGDCPPPPTCCSHPHVPTGPETLISGAPIPPPNLPPPPSFPAAPPLSPSQLHAPPTFPYQRDLLSLLTQAITQLLFPPSPQWPPLQCPAHAMLSSVGCCYQRHPHPLFPSAHLQSPHQCVLTPFTPFYAPHFPRY